MFGFIDKIKNTYCIEKIQPFKDIDNKFKDYLVATHELTVAVNGLSDEVKTLTFESDVRDRRIKNLEYMVKDHSKYIDTSTKLYNSTYYNDYISEIIKPNSTVLTITLSNVRDIKKIGNILYKMCGSDEYPIYWSYNVLKIFSLKQKNVDELSSWIHRLRLIPDIEITFNEYQYDIDINTHNI
jgi:hypothetical protein